MDLDLDLLASIASGGLGHWAEAEGGAQTYVKDDDCIACLKDLQSFFRDDDPEERPAFFAVSNYNFARSDLVPLIVTYPEDYDVVFNALKVCTFLTMPHAEGEVARHPAQQAQRMQQVCEAFLARDALAVVVGLLAEPLSRHPGMDERDAALVQLVISFLRNLLAAAAPPPPGAPPAAAEAARRVRAGLVGRLFEDEVLELVLLMAQHARERPFKSEAPVLVDIFLHLFAGSTPEALLAAPAALAAAQAATAAARPAPPRPRAAPGPPGGAPPQHVLAAPPRPPRPCPAKTVARYGPARQVFAGAVYVRRHLDHSANVVLRHAPHRGELPRVKQGADPKQAKAHALERGGGGAAAAAPAPGDLRALALAARLDALMRRFLAESYTPLLGQVQKELRPGLGVTLLSEAEFEAFVRLVTLCTRYVRLQQERRLRAAMGGGAEGGAEGAAEGAEAAAAAAPEDGAASPFACLSATLGWETFHLVQVTWVLASDAEAKGATQKDRPDKAWGLQHALAPLVREMMLTLDLARVAGAPGDRRAADRLQRRLLHDDMRGSGLLPVVARLVRGYNYRFQPRQHAVDLVEVLHIVLCTLDRLAAATPGGFRVAAPPAPRRQAAPRRGTPGAAAPSAAEAEAGAEPEADAEAGAEAGNGVDGDGDGDGAAPPGAARAASEGGAAPAQPAAEQAQRQGGEESDDEDEAAAPRDAHAPAPPAPREVSFEACRRLRQECAQPAMVHFHAWLLQGYATNAPFTNHALVSFLNRVARPAPGGLGLEPMLWQLSVLRLAHSVLADRAARAAPALAPLLALCSRVARGALRRVAPEVYALEADDGGGGAALGAAAEEAEEGGGGGGEEAAAAAAERAAGAELRKKMAAGCASMMCVELLFWKGPNVAEAVGQEYSWRKLAEPSQARAGGAAAGAGGPGAGQLGFASYRPGARRAGQFSDAQAAELREEFERCNGRKDCLEELVLVMGGAFKKAHISRQLRAMGLARGRLTPAQGARAAALYESHADKGPRYRFEAVAGELGAGFTGAQVKRHLTQAGVAPPGGKRRGGGGGGAAEDDGWDAMLLSEGEEEQEGEEEEGGQGQGQRAAAGRVGGAAGVQAWSDSEDDEGAGAGGAGPAGGGGVSSEEEQDGAEPARPRSEAAGGAGGADVAMAESPAADVAARGGGGGSKKRKSPAAPDGGGGEAAGAAAARRAEALEALRRKRRGGAEPAAPEPAAAAAAVEVVEPAAQEQAVAEEAKENAAAAQAPPQGKTFSRRRLKKAGGGGGGALAAPAPLGLDDLEDF